MVLINRRPPVAVAMDQYLDQGTIWRFLITPHQTQVHTQILDTPTIHQRVTVTALHSHNHSWRVVISLHQTKLKYSTKLPKNKWNGERQLTDEMEAASSLTC